MSSSPGITASEPIPGLHHDFVDFSTLKPQPHQPETVTTMLDEVITSVTAMKTLR